MAEPVRTGCPARWPRRARCWTGRAGHPSLRRVGEAGMATGQVRLALVDDRPLFCRGLQLLLPAVTAERVQVAGSTDDATAAAGLVRRCQPDLGLVALALPPPGGVRAMGAIRRTEPAVPVVAMSRNDEPGL